jgi:hypothetical protein
MRLSHPHCVPWLVPPLWFTRAFTAWVRQMMKPACTAMAGDHANTEVQVGLAKSKQRLSEQDKLQFSRPRCGNQSRFLHHIRRGETLSFSTLTSQISSSCKIARAKTDTRLFEGHSRRPGPQALASDLQSKPVE